MRMLFRTACGCERIVLEASTSELGVQQEIAVPLVPTYTHGFERWGKLSAEANRIQSRLFRLTEQTWVSDGEELFIYEEVL